ncbi:response regulator [Roseobacter weihaiensis]|uniref:response regulator n=1 Tax=Roseobacter weihaiensis TaxID=2763262 RepID=UPI001D0BCC3A|nr:response regulator transcription factor [Roseobacter sp. H9]
MKILFVEDEATIAETTIPAFQKQGFPVDHVETVRDAEAALSVYDYDLILLDRVLPDGDGLDLLAALRRAKDATPVILMSSIRHSVAERISGLDRGADDYITKPFDRDELISRARSILRRPAAMSRRVIEIANVVMDIEARSLIVGGTAIRVARRELSLLEQLLGARGRIVPREAIERNCYGFDDEVSVNAIDVSLHRLRKALVDAGARIAIVTVRGIGYMVEETV